MRKEITQRQSEAKNLQEEFDKKKRQVQKGIAEFERTAELVEKLKVMWFFKFLFGPRSQGSIKKIVGEPYVDWKFIDSVGYFSILYERRIQEFLEKGSMDTVIWLSDF